MKEAWKYALWGALFGCLFPIIATLIEASSIYQSTQWEYLLAVQENDMLLWIIDTAPFFLGLFAFFIGLQIDKLKQKHRQILSAQSQLVLQEQMASVGKVTAGIVHEIKNPLNVVSNFSEGSVGVVDDLVAEIEKLKPRLEPTVFDYLMELIDDLKQNAIDIRNNSDRVNRIVYALSDHTRRRKGSEKPIDINLLLDENVNLAFHAYCTNYPSFNLAIEKDYDTAIPLVTLNAQNLGRILLHLLNNACYALYEKLVIAESNFEPTLFVETKKRQGKLEINLMDNGNGIPKNIREKVFEPFFTTKPIGEGNTGLGLSISKDIIMKEYNGTIEIDSKEGHFTKLIIIIPIDQRVIVPIPYRE